jgi:hypothetical protein
MNMAKSDNWQWSNGAPSRARIKVNKGRITIQIEADNLERHNWYMQGEAALCLAIQGYNGCWLHFVTGKDERIPVLNKMTAPSEADRYRTVAGGLGVTLD